jgi:hypothetical protein
MKDADLEKCIQDSAQYIRNRRKLEREFGKGAEDYEILKGKLDRADRKLNEMLDELTGITVQMQSNNRWHGYREVLRYVRKAREAAGAALGPLSDAKVVIRRDPATRAMWEQKTALNLAHGHLEPPGKPNRRGTRALARRIMDAAGIEEPSPEAMTKWLREIRAEWDASERRCAEMSKAERNGK